MEDKLDLLLAKLIKLEKTIESMKATMEAHRVEHGFAKMQDGGVNAQFTGQQTPPGMGVGGMPQGGPPGIGRGMGQGYQMPGQGMPMQDPSRPPGM